MTSTGVLLMTYGSPRDYRVLEDVAAYMTRVRAGRRPDDNLVREFQRRYALIGGSPLVDITERLARGVERALQHRSRVGSVLVQAAMRFSDPSIADVVSQLAARGVERLLGLVLSPQYSPALMGGYASTLDEAASRVGLEARMVGSWHLEPAFVQVLAQAIQRGLAQLPNGAARSAPVLLTAHSLPRSVVEREPGYVEQLEQTAAAVADAAGLARERWHFAYQSAGHTHEEWLKPDLLDVLPLLAAAGHRQVLVAPVQFLADHLETLYDIDVGGREQAEAAGISGFVRAPAPNDSPDFAAALADVVEREVHAWGASPALKGVVSC